MLQGLPRSSTHDTSATGFHAATNKSDGPSYGLVAAFAAPPAVIAVIATSTAASDFFSMHMEVFPSFFLIKAKTARARSMINVPRTHGAVAPRAKVGAVL